MDNERNSRPLIFARPQPNDRARWQRLPSGNGPDVCPRLCVVGDPWKSPAQLDHSRKLTLLVKDGADRFGVGLGHEKHPKSMLARRAAGKFAVVGQ